MRSILPLLLACAVIWGGEPPTAPAQLSPLAPTPLRWDAGRSTLAAAVARLGVGGNRVWLAAGVDDTLEAELPAVAATWWDGVIAICRAFNLRPDDGEASEEQLELPGTPVPIGHGTLVLTRDRLVGMQVLGGLLASAEIDGAVRLRLRAEPRVARGTLAWARADAPAILPDRGITLEPFDLGETASPAAVWRTSALVPPASSLAVAIQAATVLPWTARCRLAVGVTSELQADGQTVKAVLVVDPAVTTWEGQSLPDRRPVVVLTGPNQALQRAQFRLRQGEAELATRGGGSHSEGNGGLTTYRFLRAPPEGAVDLEVEGRSVNPAEKSELRLPLASPESGPGSTPAEAPAPLRWEAAERPLSAWLGLLAASGNPVLPEVGVDTTATLALPAIRGGFWDGVQRIGSTTGLAPALSANAPLSGGAVRLVRRQPFAAAVCGPLWIDAQRSDAQPGELSIRLRAVLEPRLNEDGFSAPEFRWASWAMDDQGRAHPLAASTTPQAEGGITTQVAFAGGVVVRRNGEERSTDTSSGTIATIRLAAHGAQRLTLSGLVVLPRVRLWRASTELVPNEPCEVLLGTRATELTALSAQTRVGANQWGPGLLMRGMNGIASVQYSLATADGQAIEHPGEANRMGGGPFAGRPWVGWCRIPAQGRLTAEIVAKAALPPLVLPVQLTVPVPDGL